MTILKVEDDESPLCPVMKSDLVFQLVYLLMVEVDECLRSGVHLRDTEGRLLCYFDQVVLALKEGSLQRIEGGTDCYGKDTCLPYLRE